MAFPNMSNLDEFISLKHYRKNEIKGFKSQKYFFSVHFFVRWNVGVSPQSLNMCAQHAKRTGHVCWRANEIFQEKSLLFGGPRDPESFTEDNKNRRIGKVRVKRQKERKKKGEREREERKIESIVGLHYLKIEDGNLVLFWQKRKKSLTLSFVTTEQSVFFELLSHW